jgi:hypothetical protein
MDYCRRLIFMVLFCDLLSSMSLDEDDLLTQIDYNRGLDKGEKETAKWTTVDD